MKRIDCMHDSPKSDTKLKVAAFLGCLNPLHKKDLLPVLALQSGGSQCDGTEGLVDICFPLKPQWAGIFCARTA